MSKFSEEPKKSEVLKERGFSIKVLPWGLRLKYRQGETIQQNLARGGIYVESPCGGRGTCGKCTVKVAYSQDEDFQEVLSCQTVLEETAVVEVPLAQEYEDVKSAMSVLTKEIELQPSVELIDINLKSTKDSYEEELRRQLSVQKEGREAENYLELLNQAAEFAGKDEDFSAAMVDGLPAEINPGKTMERHMLGVAIDLGTTTVMGSLMDLREGTALATTSKENLQKFAGADVISRSNYAMQDHENLKELQQKTVKTINQILKELLSSFPAPQEDVFEMTVVGNTTMLHLLLGLSPRSLVLAPYHPVLRRQTSVVAERLGININPKGRVYTSPCISSYVGADALSAVMATGLHQGERPRLLIDIGTNGEMVLGWKDRIAACSTAAGPAFEGAKIRNGMRGAPGAIGRVNIDHEKVDYDVIGGERPQGIAGSGLVDAVAAMLNSGVIFPIGKFADPDSLPQGLKERFREGEQGIEFVLATPEESHNSQGISLNRKDVGELQLAKGAICAGVKILLKYLDLKMEQVEEVLLAGAFGNYLRKTSAASIGLWPDYPEDKVKGVGNAAGVGAQMMLISQPLRREGENLYREIEHLNLGGHPDFTQHFSQSMMLNRNV